MRTYRHHCSWGVFFFFFFTLGLGLIVVGLHIFLICVRTFRKYSFFLHRRVPSSHHHHHHHRHRQSLFRSGDGTASNNSNLGNQLPDPAFILLARREAQLFLGKVADVEPDGSVHHHRAAEDRTCSRRQRSVVAVFFPTPIPSGVRTRGSGAEEGGKKKGEGWLLE